MLKVLIAPTAYKGTLSPAQVARAIEAGLKAPWIDISVVMAPLADGGDGTVEALHLALGGSIRRLEVSGPLAEKVTANWLQIDRLAIVELAQASGLACVVGALDPIGAHTHGAGELLRHCLKSGMEQIVVAVGGSASTDGGSGALRALGAKFLDGRGNELPLGGLALMNLEGCDLSALERWKGRARIKVATDVTSPLLGIRGAAHVYAPQKGANSRQVMLLEKALSRLADVLETATRCSIRDLPGAGAAGGTAFGLACALGADIVPGFDWIARTIDLDSKIANADIVVSGEGQLDEQSIQGKVIGGLASKCALHGRPLWAIPARIDPGFDFLKAGIARVVPACTQGQFATAADISKAARDLFLAESH